MSSGFAHHLQFFLKYQVLVGSRRFLSLPRKEFDYIIVGGGSAGCVLANRLSADNDVLLVEVRDFSRFKILFELFHLKEQKKNLNQSRPIWSQAHVLRSCAWLSSNEHVVAKIKLVLLHYSAGFFFFLKIFIKLIESNLTGRKLYYPRGRILGGSRWGFWNVFFFHEKYRAFTCFLNIVS